MTSPGESDRSSRLGSVATGARATGRGAHARDEPHPS